MATKKAASNKSQFVRDQDLSLSAADVVAKAKAKGLTMTPAFVYSIRSAAKAKAANSKGTVKARKRQALTGERNTGNGLLEDAIRRIVREEIRAHFARLA